MKHVCDYERLLSKAITPEWRRITEKPRGGVATGLWRVVVQRPAGATAEAARGGPCLARNANSKCNTESCTEMPLTWMHIRHHTRVNCQ